ncbi:unnamed protein product [Tilletia controversa]|uniref:Uncharacterized protein n=3 Tax=Tilletia TaxID=13289 RepID=A0A8X7MQ02_9BASI|nr:hypothetical protein CF336_g5551 [Tilletia laevis]KAE8193180.1 hypothetical protein CF328_g5123 [Tilletia controversa]KAE8256883.1 hypothetical protein A4X03_0g4963 [Tilletia caries]KAE8196209.1 hypothetical protein CF335_g4915 [Tilletia laevis]KAE8243914.1 hypothetical protein A4X06_0g6058 [Tilletia controversa]
MVSISSTTAALCPQSFASMAPCTQCTHHANRTNSIPFPADMEYLHASSSRILTPTRAERYTPDDVEAADAAAFWSGAGEEDYNGGYMRRCSDAEWGGFEGDEGDDDDSRSDLGAPEMDEQSWNAPPPAYESVTKGSSSSSHHSRGSSSSLSAEAGTLQLSVNASILTLPPSPSSTSSTSRTTTEINPTKPSLLSLTFLGTTRAHARARRQAERKAAHLEELHDAWARLGLNTREMLARGGVGALPPYFSHPPRCELGEMVARLP